MTSKASKWGSTIAVAFAMLTGACAGSEEWDGRPDDEGDRADQAVAMGLAQVHPSAIWAVEIDGSLQVSINAESFGDKLFYNYNMGSGQWWSEEPGNFDDLPGTSQYCDENPGDNTGCHPWKRLNDVDGMYPWGTDHETGAYLAGNLTAGYTYTDRNGTDMFTFMNRDKFWVMCTNCGGSYPELFSGALDRLDDDNAKCDGTPGDDDCHPWSRIRRGDGSHAWLGAGITGSFQHPTTGDFYLFNERDYWVLKTDPGRDGFGGLYPEQIEPRSVESLTGSAHSRVTGAIALPRGIGGSEGHAIALLDDSRWRLFDTNFSATGETGGDAVNLLTCVRDGHNCGTEDDEFFDAQLWQVPVPSSGHYDVSWGGPQPIFGYGRIEMSARVFYDTFEDGGRAYMRVRAMNLEGTIDTEDVAVAGWGDQDKCTDAVFTSVQGAGVSGGAQIRTDFLGDQLGGQLHYANFDTPIEFEINRDSPAQITVSGANLDEPAGCPLGGLLLVKQQ